MRPLENQWVKPCDDGTVSTLVWQEEGVNLSSCSIVARQPTNQDILNFRISD
jgi:hypothetical protein